MAALRSSCQFCRRRKIRCSGESTGCLACVGRPTPCVYEISAPIGRPKRATTKEGSAVEATTSRASGGASGSGESGGRARTSEMGKVARDLAAGEAECGIEDATAELETGMLKLRLSSSVRSTFSEFATESVGTIAQSFFGLVSSSSAEPPQDLPRTPYRAPQGTRFLYELAFQARRASKSKDPGTSKLAVEAQSDELWERFPSEIMSLATAGIPNSREPNREEPLFVRLLQEDESRPFACPPLKGAPLLPNPVLSLPPHEIHELLSTFFLRNPLSFILNDALLLSSISHNTHDPALLSIIVGIALSLPPPPSPPPPSSPTSLPLSLPPSAFSHTPTPPRDPESFLGFGEQALFARSAEFAATSIETIQALLLLGAHRGSRHRTRQSWAIMCCGYALTREGLKRMGERSGKEIKERGERGAIEDEMLVAVCWMFAIFGSWSFLSLGLPRSTLVDVTDALPLPPFHPTDSLSYLYRTRTTPNLPCASSLEHGIKGFNETCRILSLVVSLSVKNGPHSAELNPRESTAFRLPLFVADGRLGHSSVFNLHVSNWLIGMAEQHVSPTSRNGAKDVQHSAFLSCVHAIMAVHRLAPFDEPSPSNSVELEAPALRLALRAMELVVRASMERVRKAVAEGGGRVSPDEAKNGLLRLVGDALPHCLRLMGHLAEMAPTSTEVYALVYSQQERISTLLEDLIFLTNSGLAIAIRPLAAKPVEAKRPRSPSDVDGPSSPPLIRIPLAPSLPLAAHYHSLPHSPTAIPSLSPSANFAPRKSRSWSSSSHRSRSGSTSSTFGSGESGWSPLFSYPRERSGSNAFLAVPSPASFNSSLPSSTSSFEPPFLPSFNSSLPPSFNSPHSFNPSPHSFNPSIHPSNAERSSATSLQYGFSLPPSIDRRSNKVPFGLESYEEEFAGPVWRDGGEKGFGEFGFS